MKQTRDSYDEFLMSCDNSIRFAIWLTHRQTEEEMEQYQTIEKNHVGWNMIDARLSKTCEAIEAGDVTDERHIRRFYCRELIRALPKYYEQWKEYIARQ